MLAKLKYFFSDPLRVIFGIGDDDHFPYEFSEDEVYYKWSETYGIWHFSDQNPAEIRNKQLICKLEEEEEIYCKTVKYVKQLKLEETEEGKFFIGISKRNMDKIKEMIEPCKGEDIIQMYNLSTEEIHESINEIFEKE